MASDLHPGVSRVRIQPKAKAPEDEPPPPDGVWMVLARAPGGPTHWWLHAYDDDARRWAADHPGDVTSGCIEQPAARLSRVGVLAI